MFILIINMENTSLSFETNIFLFLPCDSFHKILRSPQQAFLVPLSLIKDISGTKTKCHCLSGNSQSNELTNILRNSYNKRGLIIKAEFVQNKVEKVKVLVSQSCPTLCNPVDCSPPGSSAHRILQARILELVIISSSSESSWSTDWTWVSCIVGRFCTIWDPRKAVENLSKKYLSLFVKGKKRFPYSLHIILMIKVITFFYNYFDLCVISSGSLISRCQDKVQDRYWRWSSRSKTRSRSWQGQLLYGEAHLPPASGKEGGNRIV